MDTKKNPYRMPDEVPLREKKYFPGRIDASKQDNAQDAAFNAANEVHTDISGGYLGIDKGNSKGMY
ncbi:MAG: hypothetical protein Q8876_05785 [Bacillota bacterium]|nr:hypothetical protein [Bacillota bacterium]